MTPSAPPAWSVRLSILRLLAGRFRGCWSGFGRSARSACARRFALYTRRRQCARRVVGLRHQGVSSSGNTISSNRTMTRRWSRCWSCGKPDRTRWYTAEYYRSGDPSVISSIIGGAMLPHAPQFITMPETEDPDTVGRVRAVAAGIGARLRAMAPDLWIIFSNDHAEQFFHVSAPPFTIHVGDEATGAFAGREFRWKIP